MGEHTKEVLGEWIGVREADVRNLEEAGSIWQFENENMTNGELDPTWKSAPGVGTGWIDQ
jgi:hypothetical protein